MKRVLSGLLLIVGVAASGWGFAEQCFSPVDTYSEYDERIPARQINDIQSDYYVLSYSWAPDFCAHKAKPDSKKPGKRNYLQCASDFTFGYILHGLWPQGSKEQRGNYPRACEGDQPKIPRAVLNKYLCMTPSVWLLQHEYEYHGTCMHDESLETPDAYFSTALRLHSQLTFPQKKLKNNQAGIQWWLDNNPHLTRESIQYASGLNEWQFCYDNHFNATNCSMSAASSSSNRVSECHIKGNISRSGKRYYFLPGHPDYQNVKIDSEKGERCFQSEQQALDAGWRKVP